MHEALQANTRCTAAAFECDISKAFLLLSTGHALGLTFSFPPLRLGLAHCDQRMASGDGTYGIPAPGACKWPRAASGHLTGGCRGVPPCWRAWLAMAFAYNII